MAEFLVFDKDHWLDKLNSEEFAQQREDQSDKWDKSYLARYQKGDIIEVRPDGFWTGPKARGFNQEAFRVVSIPGLAPEDKWIQPKVRLVTKNDPVTGEQYEEEDVLRRRKYRFKELPEGKIVVLPTMTAIEV